MSENTTDDGEVENTGIPTDVDGTGNEVQIPSEQDTSDNLSRRKKKELERLSKEEALEKKVEELEAVVSPFMKEQAFNESLKSFGLSKDEVDQESFDAEFKSLKEEGLSTKKATEMALRLAGSQIKANQDQDRESGRSRAALPPTSTQQGDRTVYTESQIANLPQAEYEKIMNLRDAGKIIVK